MSARMTLARIASGLVGLALGTCGGQRDVLLPDNCKSACATLAACGILPSSLGWSESIDVTQATENCEFRCARSDPDDELPAALFDCLAVTPESDPATIWCQDEASQLYPCGPIAECIRDAQLAGALGSATVEVKLIERFTYESLVDTNKNSFALVQSTPLDATAAACRSALCNEVECLEPSLSPCSDSLCGVGLFSTELTCEQLGVSALELGLFSSSGTTIASSSLTDDDPCAAPTFVFNSDEYEILAGPVRPYVRIRGTLGNDVLESVGNPDFLPSPETDGDSETDGDTDTDTDGGGMVGESQYCWTFYGPTFIVPSGSSIVVVPLPDLGFLVNNKQRLDEGMGDAFAIEPCQ